MRKEKWEELESLIYLYKTIEKTNVNITSGKFIKIGSSNYTLGNGKVITREEIIKNNGMSSASIILPITDNNEVILTVQPRVVTKLGVGIELPAGYIDANETGYDAALRELKEETGYIPDKLVKVAEYYQDQGCSRSLNECFLATGCEKLSSKNLDGDEYISEFMCTFEEMLELVEKNYINDAGSIITIERSKKLIR